MWIKAFVSALIVCCVISAPAQTSDSGPAPPTRATYLELEGQVEDALHTDVLNLWFPRSADNMRTTMAARSGTSVSDCAGLRTRAIRLVDCHLAMEMPVASGCAAVP